MYRIGGMMWERERGGGGQKNPETIDRGRKRKKKKKKHTHRRYCQQSILNDKTQKSRLNSHHFTTSCPDRKRKYQAVRGAQIARQSIINHTFKKIKGFLARHA